MSNNNKTTGLTKDEVNWVLERIAEGDTDWLRDAMSDYLRKRLEEDARSKGKSLLHLYTDTSCSNGGHEETDSLGSIDSGHGSCPGTDKLRGPEGIA